MSDRSITIDLHQFIQINGLIIVITWIILKFRFLKDIYLYIIHTQFFQILPDPDILITTIITIHPDPDVHPDIFIILVLKIPSISF